MIFISHHYASPLPTRAGIGGKKSLMRTEFVPVLHVDLFFSKEEVAALMDCCQNHYDRECRSLAEQGGLVFGMNNQVNYFGYENSNSRLTFRQLDLLAKATEGPQTLSGVALHRCLVEILKEMRSIEGKKAFI